jgi:thiol peroxidase
MEIIERTGAFQLAGKDVTIIGSEVQAGEKAIDFMVQALDWTSVRGLTDTVGKVRIIAAVPSLDTEVCDRETRHLNELAANLGEEVVIEVISTDLPYTQKKWCGATGVDKVMVLSDHLTVDFGMKYGCLIKERRILRRAVFVIDKQDTVAYAAYMPALSDEPDYDYVLQVAQKLQSNMVK